MIDRCQFLPAGAQDGDFPVPINDNFSVPSARMAYLLAGLLTGSESVLEIGTGSGFQTAVLAERYKQVVSIEACPLPGVAEKLSPRVCLIHADGMTYDTGEQFDAILVTFAVTAISSTWIGQLKLGGNLVVPVKVGENSCRISVYEKTTEDWLQLLDVCGYAPFTEAVTIQ